VRSKRQKFLLELKEVSKTASLLQLEGDGQDQDQGSGNCYCRTSLSVDLADWKESAKQMLYRWPNDDSANQAKDHRHRLVESPDLAPRDFPTQ